MAFVQLKELIPRALASKGLTRQAKAAVVCEKYRTLAPQIVRPDILEHTFPKTFQGGILTVGVENGAWAQLIIAAKIALISGINAAIGDSVVRELKTTVSIFPSSHPLGSLSPSQDTP